MHEVGDKELQFSSQGGGAPWIDAKSTVKFHEDTGGFVQYQLPEALDRRADAVGGSLRIRLAIATPDAGIVIDPPGGKADQEGFNVVNAMAQVLPDAGPVAMGVSTRESGRG